MLTKVRTAVFVLVSLTFVVAIASGAFAAYPPVGAPGSPVVAQGNSESITFSSLQPETAYHVVVHSAPVDLGMFLSDAAGSLTVTFNTAGLDVGPHTVTGTSPTGTMVSVMFTVTAPTVTPVSGSSSASGLAFTGARVWGVIAAAVCLVVLGLVAIRIGRRHRV